MAATVVSLQARADGGQFTLVQTAATSLKQGSMPIQQTHPLQMTVPHASPNRTAISWSAVYRTMRLPGDVLVVDTAVASSFVQLVLDHVNVVFDAIDLRMNLVGYPANAVLGPVGQANQKPGLPPGS